MKRTVIRNGIRTEINYEAPKAKEVKKVEAPKEVKPVAKKKAAKKKVVKKKEVEAVVDEL